MPPIDISIILCTYNRADMLRLALPSLLRQEARGEFTYEVIVVDNGSSDDTSQVVHDALATADVPARYILETQPGHVFAWNRGVAEARGEWIASFDDDQVAEPDWLYQLLATAKDKNCLSVGGAIRLMLPDGCDRKLHPQTRLILGESFAWEAERPYTRRHGPGSGNQLLHRSVIDRVGGFDPEYASRGYDMDLYRRIREAGYVSWFTPKAVGHHITPPQRMEEPYLWRTCRHNGWSFHARDHREQGALRSTAIGLLRVGHALAVRMPRLVAARLRGDREGALGVKCGLWQTLGYVEGCLGRSPLAGPSKNTRSKAGPSVRAVTNHGSANTSP